MSQGKDLRHVRQKLSDHSFGILDLLNSCMKSVDKSGAASSRRARCELLATKAANTIERLNGELASFVECSEAAIDPEPPPWSRSCSCCCGRPPAPRPNQSPK
jgi:hypothetical protein